MLGAWIRVGVFLALLTLAATDRSLTLWAGTAAAALLAARLLLDPTLTRLRIRQALEPAEVFVGEHVRVHLWVTNRTLLPLPVLHCEVCVPRRLGGRPLRWLLGLAPRDTQRTAFPLQAAARGVYLLGCVNLEVRDWFGLWRRRGFVEAPLWLTVFPRPLAAAVPPPPPRLPAGERPQPASPFLAWEPAGLRPYRRGDPLRWIAWKASAHRGDLVVRVFPPVRDRSHLILLDLRPAAWPGDPTVWSERALSLAAGWVLQAAVRGEPVGLHAWGCAVRFRPDPEVQGGEGGQAPASRRDAVAPAAALELPVRRGERARQELLRALALLHPADGPPFAPGALAAARRTPGSGLLWICGRADGEVLRAAASARRDGHAVSLFVAHGAIPSQAPAGVQVWPLQLEDMEAAAPQRAHAHGASMGDG